MVQFTEKELKQIMMVVQDMPILMETIMKRIPNLSIAGAKMDLLAIQLKCEAALNEIMLAPAEKPQENPTHAPDCKNPQCWGECKAPSPIVDLKNKK